ncbi:MAG: 2,3-bisphosphoglycerate-independent phosphoglycerate mutase, partial [Dehalococcoidales bacterium]
VDGLGGLPDPETGKTELETANTPNLDKLAMEGICGLSDPVAPGITPGSAPGHLALFGYNPFSFAIGRGVLEAVGIDFDLQPEDVAVRGNFCTVDTNGVVVDRRAGRISTEKCIELCQIIDGMVLGNTRVIVRPVKEHRFMIVFRGGDLSPEISESDPQQTGVMPRDIAALSPEASASAAIVNRFVDRAKALLAEYLPANMILMRGFSKRPHLPNFSEIYQIKPAAIASYPMYHGLARLIGMEILETGESIEDEFATLKNSYHNYDFFFLHVKGTDAAGEDGDFGRKVSIIEQFDYALPMLLNMQPDVIVVTADHSTPATLGAHSWHPVPVLIHSKWCRTDSVTKFSESACIQGGLGRLSATQIMPLAMANALKLNKYGA